MSEYIEAYLNKYLISLFLVFMLYDGSCLNSDSMNKTLSAELAGPWLPHLPRHQTLTVIPWPIAQTSAWNSI
jgi:hypothetical protein